MLAPGVRIVRGPDWTWGNQGRYTSNIMLPITCLTHCNRRRR